MYVDWRKVLFRRVKLGCLIVLVVLKILVDWILNR